MQPLYRHRLGQHVHSHYSELPAVNQLVFSEISADIELADALGQLLSILENGINSGDVVMGERTRKELLQWYVSQPAFIRRICQQSMQEAGLLPEDHEKCDLSKAAS